jgi:ribosome-associated toxin RatA of RatAB toxin-antitoxin module
MKSPLLLLASLLLAAPVSRAKPFAEFIAEDQAKLRSGEVLTWGEKDGKKRFVLSAALLAHPIDHVWALLDDKESAPTFIPNVRSAKILSREGNVVELAQETLVPGTNNTFSYILRHTSTYPNRVDFVRLSGDLRHIEGAWILESVDDGAFTLLVYRLHLDAGLLVPQAFVANSQMKSLPGILAAIRDTLPNRPAPPARLSPLSAGLPTAAAVTVTVPAMP